MDWEGLVGLQDPACRLLLALFHAEERVRSEGETLPESPIVTSAVVIDALLLCCTEVAMLKIAMCGADFHRDADGRREGRIKMSLWLQVNALRFFSMGWWKSS